MEFFGWFCSPGAGRHQDVPTRRDNGPHGHGRQHQHGQVDRVQVRHHPAGRRLAHPRGQGVQRAGPGRVGPDSAAPHRQGVAQAQGPRAVVPDGQVHAGEGHHRLEDQREPGGRGRDRGRDERRACSKKG